MDTSVFASATTLARAIRNGQIAVEAVETCLRRVDAVSPRLNAVVHVEVQNHSME